MTRSIPIADSELAELLRGLLGFKLLVLAVSGGADSMALMHLVARWRRLAAPNAPAVHVATVDHGLRAASRSEADAVAAAASVLALPHVILTWTGDKPAAGLQQAARAARYTLLAEYLQGLGEPNAAVVTAHTAEDQAETLLMRLARGSGLDGLAGMRSQRQLVPGHPYALCRPLLAVAKARLIATLRDAGMTWVEDPSNSRMEFERVRLRSAATSLAALGLSADKLALSARRLGRAREVVEDRAAAFERDVLDVNGGAFAALDRAQFAVGHEELRLRLLARVLDAFGGASPAPRMQEIEHLLSRLSQETAFAATLGGCVVRAGSRALRVFREPGRLSEVLSLPDASPRVWDGRFRVSVRGRDAPIVVRSLGKDGYATLRANVHHSLPQLAASTLPAFWIGDRLLAVPGLAGNEMGPKGAASADWPSGVSFACEFVGLPDETRNLP